MTVQDFKKATLGQLLHIIRGEGTTIEKCVAQSELERRLDEYGIGYAQLLHLAA